MLKFAVIVLALVVVILVVFAMNLANRLKMAKNAINVERNHANAYQQKYQAVKDAIRDTYEANRKKGVMVAGIKKILTATKDL